jgi:uncharacterized membrane protein
MFKSPGPAIHGIAIVFLILGILTTVPVVQRAQEYRDARNAYAQDLAITQRLLNPDEWIGNPEDIPYLADQHERKLQISHLRSQSLIRAGMLGATFLLLLLGWLIAFRQKGKGTHRVIGVSMVALLCLGAGLTIPMLEIAAYEHQFSIDDLPIRTKIFGANISVNYSHEFPGDLYFFYQSKSALQLISTLLRQQNWVVGFSLILFSVLFPLAKTGITWIAAARPALIDRRWFQRVVLTLGKWSMADVFVVAVFLGFLAFGNMQVGVPTESQVLPGLYFFLGYCVLSVGLSQSLRSERGNEV